MLVGEKRRGVPEAYQVEEVLEPHPEEGRQVRRGG